LPDKSSDEPDSPGLDRETKEKFLKAWGLKEGDLTDEQIEIAIATGHF